MATIIADNIISPLGLTTGENLRAVMSGQSSLCRYEATDGLPFPYTASCFSDTTRRSLTIAGYTFWESLVINSIRRALGQCQGLMNGTTALILSTTKANVGMLKSLDDEPCVTSPGQSALRVAQALGIDTTPIVVSNACISGVSAMITADRLLKSGDYDNAIVCGAEELSRFIISGFHSLMALSEDECRPFDIERLGLNLGEAAATVILTRHGSPIAPQWQIMDWAVSNDSYHISSPSPRGDGALRVLDRLTRGIDINDMAVINLHGTATMYNDQMESKAIERANMSDVPANALKGYFGHTMGAAGILETVLTYRALDEGLILATRGFSEIGVSAKVNISPETRKTDKKTFVKIISGFGGGNAGIRITKTTVPAEQPLTCNSLSITHRVTITPHRLWLDGVDYPTANDSSSPLTDIYKKYVGDYPKFYKMDSLSKLGFVAARILTDAESDSDATATRDIALFNKKSSLMTDIEYIASVGHGRDFFPSPSIFVYTLPNIVTGEIAINHKYCGETVFYVLPDRDDELINRLVRSMTADKKHSSILAGWVEYESPDQFVADMFIAQKQ